MMTAIEGLQPREFASTAARAVSECTSLPLRQQASHLGDSGLLGVMASQDVGGLELPLSFAVPVVAAGGAGLLGFALTETLLLTHALQETLPRVAEAIVSGKMVATIAWQGTVSAARAGGSIALNGDVAQASCARDADYVLVRIAAGGAVLVPTNTSGFVIEDAETLDVAVPAHGVRLQNVTVPLLNVVSAEACTRLWSDANVLRAAAILGSAEACLAMAQEHASTRRQFGRALSFNQALRHSLARQKLALEGIRHAITRAVGDDATPMARDAVFLAAATSGCFICEGALQIHGGMGFTWDVPVHRHLRRVRALRAQGDAAQTLLSLGRRTIAAITPADDLAMAPLEMRHD